MDLTHMQTLKRRMVTYADKSDQEKENKEMKKRETEMNGMRECPYMGDFFFFYRWSQAILEARGGNGGQGVGKVCGGPEIKQALYKASSTTFGIDFLETLCLESLYNRIPTKSQ